MNIINSKKINSIRTNICADKNFNAITSLANKDFNQIKSHIPFMLYDKENNETIIITDIYKEQYIRDGIPSKENIKLEYLQWKEWYTDEPEFGTGDEPDYPYYYSIKHCGWSEKVILLDKFELDNMCNAFLPTEKQLNSISKEKIYELPEERVLLTSGREAFERISKQCQKMKEYFKDKNDYKGYEDWDADFYAYVPDYGDLC